MKITRKSPISGKTHEMEIPLTGPEYLEACIAHKKGVLIQNAFPTLNADQREFILTGITPEEWAATFKDEADGYEPDINDVRP